MKRLLLVFACALLLAALAPVPAGAAPKWWPHRHSKSSDPTKANKSKDKTKKSKSHHEKQRRNGVEPLYSTPNSVGWWKKQPGPAGAGS